jgi:hypothetical protein
MLDDIAFLLQLLNEIAPNGTPEESESAYRTQRLINMRLLTQGLILDYSPTTKEWFVHFNSGSGHWYD